MSRVLAVIPARGNSAGLPGKNIRPLAGLPLIAHSLKLAALCPEITRTVVSTDSVDIAETALSHGGDAPFMRPAELAKADTPMWPVLRHALKAVEDLEHQRYDFLLLLDPTSPTRLPSDVSAAVQMLSARSDADGVVSVSKPEFSPLWHTVVDEKGWMKDFSADAAGVHRRQDAREVYRINGLLYLWRAEFVRESPGWRAEGRHLMLITPDSRAVSIDDLEQFERADILARAGFFKLPWLERSH